MELTPSPARQRAIDERDKTIAELEEFFAGPEAITFQPITPHDPPPPSCITITRYMTFEEAKRRFPNTPIPEQENYECKKS